MRPFRFHACAGTPLVPWLCARSAVRASGRALGRASVGCGCKVACIEARLVGHGREDTSVKGNTKKRLSRKRSDHGSELLLPKHLHQLQLQLFLGQATEAYILHRTD